MNKTVLLTGTLFLVVSAIAAYFDTQSISAARPYLANALMLGWIAASVK